MYRQVKRERERPTKPTTSPAKEQHARRATHARAPNSQGSHATQKGAHAEKGPTHQVTFTQHLLRPPLRAAFTCSRREAPRKAPYGCTGADTAADTPGAPHHTPHTPQHLHTRAHSEDMLSHKHSKAFIARLCQQPNRPPPPGPSQPHLSPPSHPHASAPQHPTTNQHQHKATSKATHCGPCCRSTTPHQQSTPARVRPARPRPRTVPRPYRSSCCIQQPAQPQRARPAPTPTQARPQDAKRGQSQPYKSCGLTPREAPGKPALRLCHCCRSKAPHSNLVSHRAATHRPHTPAATQHPP